MWFISSAGCGRVGYIPWVSRWSFGSYRVIIHCILRFNGWASKQKVCLWRVLGVAASSLENFFIVWTIKKAECQRMDAFELWCWGDSWESPGLQGDFIYTHTHTHTHIHTDINNIFYIYIYIYIHTHRHTKSLHLWQTLCDPMDCSPPGSSVHGFSRQEYFGVGCHYWIFLTRGSNPHFLSLLHWQAASFSLSHQGSHA